MSGIVGVLNLEGAPVDRLLLQQLTNFLAFRGPDRQQIWMEGPIGFGHTLFKTTEESEHECQPLSLGGGTWIVADARIDSRAELIEQLRTHGQHPAVGATDAEMILHSYHAWGEACVDHLLGDFAFCIWDGRGRSLFCARDQMGVKPFYYAQIGAFVILSNTLDCIRQFPGLPDRLNELAIADFLLFGHNQNSATTCFVEIERLPPAYCASWAAGGCRIRRYWTMPVDEPIFYKRADDYCDQFKELLRKVVGDRLRTSRVGIFMSGGLDSTTLAAMTKSLLPKLYTSFELTAITDIDDFNPEERNCAQLTADQLGISIHFDKWDDRPIDSRWERIPFRTSEPETSGWQVLPNREYRERASTYSRVFFWGEGPDNALLLEWRPYLSYLIQHREYGRFLRAVGSTLVSQRRPPFWGRTLRKLKQFGVKSEPTDTYPDWLSEDFESRLQLRARWREIRGTAAKPIHPLRPNGYASLQSPLWQLLFEGSDAGNTRAGFEMRYPFVDLRMLRFLLCVPPLPWCRSKYLLRRAMRGVLPTAVLRRKKSGLPGDLVMKWVESFGLEPFMAVPAVHSYVNPDKIPDAPGNDLWKSSGLLRARSLNHWLQYSRKELHNDAVEDLLNEPLSRFVGRQEEKI